MIVALKVIVLLGGLMTGSFAIGFWFGRQGCDHEDS